MTILITGASGFVGRNFLENTTTQGPFIALYNHDKAFPAWAESLNKNIRPLQADLSNPADAKKVATEINGEIETCLYLAANSDPRWSVQHPLEDLHQNAGSIINLLTNLKSCGHFIYFSSGAIYEGAEGLVTPEAPIHPKLPYAISKHASENYVRHFRESGIINRYTIIRYFGGYGPYEPVRKIFTRLVKELLINKAKEFRVMGDGKNRIDAMAALDTVKGIEAVLDSHMGNNIIDFCGGKPITIRELVQRTAKLLDRQDAKLIFEGDVPEYNEFFAETDGFYARFGFEPSITLEEGMKPLVEWIQKGCPR